MIAGVLFREYVGLAGKRAKIADPGLEEFTDLIRYAYKHKLQIWKDAFGEPKRFLEWVRRRRFAGDYNGVWPDLVKSFLSGRSSTLLSQELFVKKLGSSLHGLPGTMPLDAYTMAAKFRPDVKRHRESVAKAKDDDGIIARSFRPGDKTEPEPILMAPEEVAVQAFQGWLQSARGGVASFRTRPFDGGEIIPIAFGCRLALGALPDALASIYERMILLGPQHRKGPPDFEPGFDRLRRMLARHSDDWTGVLEQLDQTRTLLVIMAAEHLERGFFNKLKAAHGLSHPRVLLMIDPDARPLGVARPGAFDDLQFVLPEPGLAAPTVNFAHLVDQETATEVPQPTWTAYRKMNDHYAAFHDPALPVCDPTEFRDHMARWAFSTGAQAPDADIAPETVRPCDVRMRAFLSAQRQTFSLDNTMGFEDLCKLPKREWPLEIHAYYNSVACWIGAISERKTATRNTADCKKLELLRFASMSLYWMHSEALSKLCSLNVLRLETPAAANGGKNQKPPVEMAYFSGVAFKNRTAQIEALLNCGVMQRRILPPFDNVVFLLPLGFRAIVCELWKRDDSEQRSLAHIAYAEILYHAETARREVSRELPFHSAGTRRARAHFLTEVLRHMARSCDCEILPRGVPTVPITPYRTESWPLYYEDITSAPGKFAFKYVPPGCKPEAVLHLAYKQILQNLMNDERGEGLALSNRYGMHRNEAETHCLLELAGFRPDPGRDEAEFLLSQAYASLELGALDCAWHSFAKMRDRFTGGNNPAYLARAHLGLIDVALERLDGPAVDRGLADCITTIADLEKAMTDSAQHFDPDEANVLRQRLAAREAARLLITKHYAATIRTIHDASDARHGKLVNPEVGNDNERVYAEYINRTMARRPKATGARRLVEGYMLKNGAQKRKQMPVPDRTELEMARVTCLENGGFGMQSGSTHRSLAFAIRYAGLQRMLDNRLEAEAQLDSVKDHIQAYGCSVRVLTMFETEAGWTLIQSGRSARAYAMYLRPSIDRARRLGFKWAERDACQAASAALAHISRAYKAYSRQDGATDWSGWFADQLEHPFQRVLDISGIARPSAKHEVMRNGQSIPQIPFHLPTRAQAAKCLQDFGDVAEQCSKLRRRIQELEMQSDVALASA